MPRQPPPLRFSAPWNPHRSTPRNPTPDAADKPLIFGFTPSLREGVNRGGLPSSPTSLPPLRSATG